MLDLSAFHAQFREETAENVRAIADGLIALERSPADRATLDAIFRAAHTIKGSARLLGFSEVGRVGHALESLLDALRAGLIALTPALNDLLLQANDATLALVQAGVDGKPAPLDPQPLITQLEAATSGSIAPATTGAAATAPAVPATTSPDLAPPPTPPAPPTLAPAPAATPAPSAGPPNAQRATVRVRVDRLERLLTIAGELSVSRQGNALHIDTLTGLQAHLGQMQRLLQGLEQELRYMQLSAPQRQGMYHQLAAIAAEAEQASATLSTAVMTQSQRVTSDGLLIDELESEVFAARLTPVATVFAPLPRAIRELGRALGKPVELTISGEQTEADRKVLDGLADPLLHLVRNALDHGLETAAEREAAGKSPTGHVTLHASTDGSQIAISVGDDGRGMDPAALRAAAVRKRLMDSAAAALLSDEEALELIFMPGFSTSGLITDISGRGVGMDVVRSRVAELGGTVGIHSALGRGTTITLRLPVSLMTSQVVLVLAGGLVWAVPSSGCSGLLRIDRGALRPVENQPMLEVEGRLLPVASLAELLDLPDSDMLPPRQHALLLQPGSSRALVLLVDELIDEREVVIKPLGPVFAEHPLAVGAAPLADGSLALVLSSQGLLDRTRRMTRRPQPAAAAMRSAPRLLIADNSFTTRELLRSIFKSAGYHVTSAVDGQDAFEQAQAGRFDLVVSDVEMPRLDGFGLTRSLRSTPALADTPVILVTSLHSDEHKRMGALAGAQAYIVKSQFDQHNLLQTIRQLVGA